MRTHRITADPAWRPVQPAADLGDHAATITWCTDSERRGRDATADTATIEPIRPGRPGADPAEGAAG